ncbi:hypothetical protein TNCV_2747021 [Trichonephila clavipes]|nr:hypothetical protein TNCV_2747021 [Trichonephila clavipes]
MVSTDGQQRLAPLRHGVNEAINHELGYSVPLFQMSSFQFLESLGVVGGQQPVLLERPKRALLDSLSGEHASHSIRTIPSSKKKSSTRSENLIPISASSQRSLSNNVDICAPVSEDATIHQHSPTTKSDTFVHERRIIPTGTYRPDENMPIIRMNRKMGLVRKKNVAPFISSPVYMLCCPLPAVATMS